MGRLLQSLLRPTHIACSPTRVTLRCILCHLDYTPRETPRETFEVDPARRVCLHVVPGVGRGRAQSRLLGWGCKKRSELSSTAQLVPQNASAHTGAPAAAVRVCGREGMLIFQNVHTLPGIVRAVW